MSWTAPRTWTTAELVTAPIMNAAVRDNLLETAVAKVTTAGDLVYATGANALTRRAIGSAKDILVVVGGVPTWVTPIGSNTTWTNPAGALSLDQILSDLRHLGGVDGDTHTGDWSATGYVWADKGGSGELRVGFMSPATGLYAPNLDMWFYTETGHGFSWRVAGTEKASLSSAGALTTAGALTVSAGGGTFLGSGVVLTLGTAGQGSATASKKLLFDVGGYGAPGAFNTASNGEKIILYRNATDNYDAAIGVDSASNVWYKSTGGSGSNGGHTFYYGSSVTLGLKLGGDGIISTGAPGSTSAAAAGDLVIGGGLFLDTASSANRKIYTASSGSGTITAYIGNASINTTSDRRLKRDITPTEVDWLAVLNRVRVRDYTWNDPSDRNNPWGKHSRGRHTGPVAQELLEDAPELRYAINATDTTCPDCRAGRVCILHEGYWNVDPWAFIGPLIDSVNRLTAANEQLTARVAALEGN